LLHLFGVNRDDEARRALGRVMRGLRRSRGVSQDALGRAADAGRTYVGSVDRGERNPSFEHLLRLLRALGVTWAEFGAALDAEPATRVEPIPAEAMAAGRPKRRRVRPHGGSGAGSDPGV
jgi:transcriptional regulator with XRE-family HTH domain